MSTSRVTAPTQSPSPSADLHGRPVTATAVRGRRRPTLIGLGVAMIAVFGLAGAWLATQGHTAQRVLVVRDAVAAGDRITDQDLGTVEIPAGSGASTIPESERASIVGQIARSTLPSGTILSPGLTGDSLVTDGASVIGVGLTPSQMPASGLTGGDAVTLVVTRTPQGIPGLEPGATWKATVVAVGPVADDGTRTVDFALAPAVAVDAATASGSGALAVVLTGPGR